MRCSDFLRLYSDFRDGVVGDPRLERRLATHVTRCRPCARYHRALGDGLNELRKAPVIEPSERFRVRLRCRLAHEEQIRRRRRAKLGRIGASVAITGVVTLLVSAAVTRSADRIETPAPPPEQPMPMVTANPGYPFVTFIELAAPTRAFSKPVSFVLPRDTAYTLAVGANYDTLPVGQGH